MIIIKRISLFLLGMMMIALSFGESVTLFGFSLSWIFAGLVAFFMGIHMLLSLNTLKKALIRNNLTNKIIFFALFWLVYAAIQGLWANDISLWKQGMLSALINIFIIIVLWYFLTSNNDIDAFLKYSIPLWLVNIGLGIYEFVSKNNFITKSTYEQNFFYVSTFFANPNDCATWMCLCFLILALYIKRRKYHKIFTVIAWAITTFIVLQTGSRACLYGMIAYAALYVISSLIIILEDKRKDRGVLKTLFWVAASAVILIIFFGVYGDMISTLIYKFSGQANQSSDFFRLEIIKDTIRVILNSLFLGVGAYQTISYIGINPHNFFLELLADFGLPIFAFTCYIFAKIINVFFDKSTDKPSRSYYLSYAISFFIISISSSSMNRLRLTWVSLIVTFLAVAYSSRQEALCDTEQNGSCESNEGKPRSIFAAKHKNKWMK